jgi:enterochelin esterase-like enzyme
MNGMKTKFLSILLLLTVIGYSQKSQIILDSLNSKSIANTVTKENSVRKIAVYLPANYENSNKKYPVLYLLHGVGDDHETFTGDTIKYHNIKDLMDTGILKNKFGEMIVVMPNEKTNWFGSFYTNSTVTGNWEDFTTAELVNFIDAKYRTIAKVSSRAIAGHSMGGYGAFTLAMKHPEVYSVTYAMNSAFICFCGELNPENPDVTKFVKAKTMEELLPSQNYVAIGLLNLARAFSPNPLNPPLYADKPFLLKGKKLIPNPRVYSKWVEKNPVVMVDKYKENLLKLKAIKFESGNYDDSRFIIENNRLLSKKLGKLKIPHQFEEYNGDHNNKLWGLEGRIYNDLLPFVSDNFNK